MELSIREDQEEFKNSKRNVTSSGDLVKNEEELRAKRNRREEKMKMIDLQEAQE